MKDRLQQHSLGAPTNDEVGALQHILQVQIPDRVCQPRNAQHCNILLALHSTTESCNAPGDAIPQLV